MAYLSKIPGIKRHRSMFMLGTCIAAATLISVPIALPTCVIWNASASVPVGLYTVEPATDLRTGDLVVTRLPASAVALASQRHYLPANVPLIKPVMAHEADTICRWNDAVFVNGDKIGAALPTDRAHRPLPRWQGCLTLSPKQVFVMNPSVPHSFDGRYFGPIERHLIMGRAHPIYIDQAGDGHFTFLPTSHPRAKKRT